MNWTLKWNLFDIDGVNTLKKGFPVMLFGNFPNIVDSGKGNHVVVAYGYENYGFLNLGVRYRVHYGWPPSYGINMNDIKLDMPTVGSSFFMTC